MIDPFSSVIDQERLQLQRGLNYFKAAVFPTIHPVHWLTSHFAVGGWSPLQRLSGMLTAHMTAIAPHNGFTWHPHRGLEIFTYVLSGELYHEDTTGGKGVIRAGEVQRMFSGAYIEHQELNRSDEEARVIQIWYVADPRYMGLDPHYEQLKLDEMPSFRQGGVVIYPIIGPNGQTDDHVPGARLTATVVPDGSQTAVILPAAGEDLFLYFVKGGGQVTAGALDEATAEYDVLIATPDASPATITAVGCELTFLSFYLPPFVPAAV